MEHGTPEMIKSEVLQAIKVLAPGGGFILSPVDNVREHTSQIHANVKTLWEEWQHAI